MREILEFDTRSRKIDENVMHVPQFLSLALTRTQTHIDVVALDGPQYAKPQASCYS